MLSSLKSASLRSVGCAVALSWFGLAIPQALAAEQRDLSVIGAWKLTSVLDSADVSGLDDEEASKLIGTVLKISKNHVRIGDHVCGSPDFAVISGDREEYIRRRAHSSAENLGLPSPVTSIHISCAYVYKKSPDMLVLNWQGVFFDAVRQQAKHRN
ncbi:hypothetical protein [Pseudoduganella armeniaca]|uniref:hypothetical protein n=1 Tax=Pseudoduganella armeniaca TaxID=2072590 RepID=UPI0011B26C04|nr:hypothetical protein [Pseudoduganella armeniaca]